ncbi:MAG: cytochrome C oxidase subunit IV family protein [Thermoanaerobaculia bacterium]
MSDHHVVPLKTYFAVFGALMVFTAITVAVAFVDLGPANNIVMLAIAAVKATLVIMFFMHARYGTRLIPLVAASGFFFVMLMFIITMSDYMSRGWLGAGTPWRPPS